MSDGDIVGTYDLEKKVEDTLILLDLTHANYGNPQRAVMIEEGIEELVYTKQGMGKAHRFALAGFGEEDKNKVYVDFEDWAGAESIMDVLYEEIEIMGHQAKFSPALKIGFDAVVKSMQKLLEGKTFRILIISEGKFVSEQDPEWKEMVDIASKVGIYIDAVKLGMNNDFTLKRIAQATNGDYVECKPGEIKSWLPSFATVKKQMDINKSEADKNLKGLLELIAQPLITIRDEITKPGDLVDLMDEGKQEYKCGICHMRYCMICKGPPFACGAYCPSCNRFFHVHCASGWAENSEDTPNNVFKCPVCFSLCKVPGELYRVKVLKGRLKDSFLPPDKQYNTKKIKAGQMGDEWYLETCTVCGNIFESEDEDVYVCGNPDCGALYHKDCLDKTEDHHDGRCRYCDSPLRRRFDSSRGVQRVV